MQKLMNLIPKGAEAKAVTIRDVRHIRINYKRGPQRRGAAPLTALHRALKEKGIPHLYTIPEAEDRLRKVPHRGLILISEEGSKIHDKPNEAQNEKIRQLWDLIKARGAKAKKK